MVASYLAEYLAGQGHQITVISTESPSKLNGKKFKHEYRNGVEVIRFFPKNLYWIYEKGKPSFIRKLFWHMRDAWNFSTQRVLRKILSNVRPDVIHTHNIDGLSPVVWYEAKRQGIPTVHTAHDYHLICPRATLLRGRGDICSRAAFPCRAYRKWYALKARDIDVFTAPSQFLLNLHQKAGMQAKKFHVVRNGIPLSPCHKNPNAAIYKKPGPVNLLYMGQLARHKGVQTLIEAFLSLPGNLPLALNIAGSGPMEPDINRAVMLDSRIRFHGFVSGKIKEELLETNDVLILPSIWYENAPVSVIEAYNKGLAVIASNIGGLPEMVKHEKTGFLFKAGDVKSLREILFKLALTPELLEKLKKAAQAASGEYTARQMARNYLEVYNALANV